MIVAKVFRKEKDGEWELLAAVSHGTGIREIDVLSMIQMSQQMDFDRGVIAFYSVQLLHRLRLEQTIPCWYESITSVSMN